jgi:hypothetical protein
MSKTRSTGIIGVNKRLDELSSLYEASLKWYWRLLAIIVAGASVISAIFQILNYCKG